MKQWKCFSSKEKLEHIGIVAIYPLILLYEQLGKSVKFLNSRGKQITASILTVCLMLTMIPLSAITVFAADTRPPHDHCSCGLATDVCDTEYEDHHRDYLFPIWEPDTRMPIGEQLEPDESGGHVLSPKVYYYLVHDVDMSDKWEIQNGGKTCNITICLYDHTITNKKSGEDTPVIDIWRGGRLYLTTCGRRSMDGDAEITHTEGALGSGIWVGGQQENTNRNTGYFYFYGGNIVRNTSTTNGGGVWVLPKGNFEMYRGSISGNTAYGNGGGVYNTGVFNMYGGEISDNDALDQGDGVYNTGEFHMTGGTISNEGIGIENTGTLVISGGTVSGSRGIRNVGDGTVKLSGNPEISCTFDAADIDYYSSNEGQIDADGYTGKPLKIAIGGATAGQDNFDLMLNKVIVKNATADKFTMVDWQGNIYTDYALVQEGNDLVLHKHNYTYSVSDNIIKETCICGHEKNATLSAPTGELVYNGNSFNASITYDEGWIGEKPTEISYTKNTVATSDTTGAGNYIASIAIENKMASVAYKIEKATPTDVSWPTGLKGIAGNRLNTITLPDGFTWINPNRVMDYNMGESGMRYQPDAKNYNPVEKSVNIKVVDDKDPTGTISIGDKNWSSFVDKENISFDVFFNEKQTVTITVDDGEYGSGVDNDEFGYYISTKKKSINELSNMTYDTWKEYTGAFEIKPNRECIIYVRFQDYANRMTYLSSDGIVLDSIAPTVSGIENGKTYCGAVEVTVSDAYFDKVTVDGIEATVTDGKFTVSPAVGAQEITAYDKAGNKTTYTITVNNGHICTYDESTEDTIVEKCQYCDFSASAQIKAPTGELVYNGNANDASIVYTGTLSGGNNLVISYGDATDTINAGKYTASITFGGKTAKVNYEVKKADYTNITWPTKLSGNVGDKVSSIVLENGFVWNNPNEIIEYEKKDYAIRYELDRKNYNSVTRLISVKAIDNVAPTGEISIGTNRWNEFLNTITFGLFFKETQTVTITVNDNEYGSGVEEVYYYLATEEKSVNELTNMALSSWVKDVFEFNINPNRKYIIYVRILDEASNETFISSEGIVVDNEAPVISGITDGATYCGDVEATVTDAYLDKVTVGGIETTVTDGKFTVSHASGTQEIKAYDKAGNVTTYTITFDNNHTYSYDESTADTIVEKCQRCNHSASAQIEKPTGALVYNGSAHNATVVYTGTLSGGNNLSISYGTAADTIGAGDYTASITLGGKTASVSYRVEKKKVTPPTIDGKVYTGETQTADITDTERYTVTANAGGKNVATYDVVLTLKDGDNYKWGASEGVDGNKITLKFQISRVANEWTENPAIVGWTYGGTKNDATGTAKFIKGDYTTIYYDKNMQMININESTEAGDYYAQLVVAATDNFTGLTSEYLPFTIKKADLTITAKDHSITYGDAPANNGVTYSGFVNGETKTVLIGTLAYVYSYAQYDDIGDNFTITPKGLTAANYEITFVPGKLTVEPLMIEFDWETLSPEDLVYDGNDKIIGTTVKNQVTSGQYDVWVWLEYHGDDTNVTEEGFYAQAFGVAGEKAYNYYVDNTDKSPVYKITKATPETNFPTGFNIDTDKKLSDIDLTGFDGYTWYAPDTAVEYDVHEYLMTFTPADTQNYKTVSKMIKVTGGDITAPTGEITLKDNKWTEFWNNLTFGLFFKDTQSITITAADTESGVKEIAYYLATEELSKDQLDALQSTDWTVDDEFNINPENKYIIYAKITDEAGNVTYVSTNGIVLFKDTEITTGEYEYTLTTKTDIVTNIKPGNNTVNMIDICEPGGNAGDMLDYFINSDGYIVLKGESLEGFTKDWYAGDYTVTVMYNALGEEYVDGDSNGDKINDTVITLTVKRFKVEKPAADSTVFTYNGSEQIYNIPESEYYTVSGNKRTNAGEQDVTVALKDTNTFEWADGTTDNLTFKFNIGKADPTVTWPNALVGNAGDKLSTVALESGFTWDNADTVIVYSDNNYGMTYTPADTNNYNILKKDIKVNGLDVTFPTGEITLKDNKWTEFWNNLTFGLFFKDTQSITIAAADTESGVQKTEYYLAAAETDDFTAVEWTAFADEFNINPNNRYVVYVKITDNAGNAVIINSDGVVLDDIKPVLSGIENGKIYYKQVEVTVTDTNLDKVEVNGEEVTVTDGRLTLTANDKAQKVVAFDKAGNVSAEISVTVEAEHNFVWGEWYDNNDGTHSKNAHCVCGADLTVTAPKNEEVVVGGLEEESEAKGTDLKLIVETDIEEIDEDTVNAIKAELGKGITAEYIDITVKDIIGDVDVTDTSRVLEIPVAFDFEGKLGITVYRNHEGVVENLKELDTRPAKDFEDGTYFLDRANDIIYIYSNQFSTYGVAYHTHEFTNVPKNDATKDADGNIEYWYCEGCDKYFADKDGTKEITKADTVLKYAESPQTGDNSNIWLWVALLFVSGLSLFGIVVTKKRKEQEAE